MLRSVTKSAISKMARLAPYAAAHENPKGAGDARPTALQIVKDQGLVGKLQGKVVIVTGVGSTEGLGFETAKAMASTGADTYVTSRHGKGKEAVEALKATDPLGKIEHLDLELDSIKSARKAAAEFRSKSKILNILICNAAVMACPLGKTQDGLETQWGTNHIGHFTFFEELKDLLLQSATPDFPSRVVTVSSIGHNQSGVRFDDINFEKNPENYQPWVSYGQSKTSNAYMATEIERRYGSQGLHAWTLHPGGIWTPLQRHQPDMRKNFEGNEQVENYMKSTEQGAATSVWAATASELLADGKQGLYLEDCAEAEPKAPGGELMTPGYAPYIYDAEAAKKLWDVSLQTIKGF